MEIPRRDKGNVAFPKPNNLTVEQAFAIIFKQHEQALKELSTK